MYIKIEKEPELIQNLIKKEKERRQGLVSWFFNEG